MAAVVDSMEAVCRITSTAPLPMTDRIRTTDRAGETEAEARATPVVELAVVAD